MSTSDPDLEARLSALRPPPPRADLRDEVLDSVRTELGKTSRPAFLDRRTTWAVAASVLLALGVALIRTNQAQERRIEALAARPAYAVRPSFVAWRHRDALLARLLHDGGRDD